jgi:hypothetical protein
MAESEAADDGREDPASNGVPKATDGENFAGRSSSLLIVRRTQSQITSWLS